MWDWTLTTPEGVISFGDDSSPIVIDRWDIVPGRLRLSDYPDPVSDGVRFGSQLRSGQSIEMSMWVNHVGDEDQARASLAELTRLWRGDARRWPLGWVATLQHPRGRHVYGRPRGFSPDPRLIERGLAPIRVEFDAIDEFWYGPTQTTRLNFAPVFTGGLPIPAEVPFVLGGGAGSSERVVHNPGDSPSWPVFEVHGPITDPWVEIPGVGRLSTQVTVPYDKVLTIDTRPWQRIVRLDGVPVHGALTGRSARLSEMRVSSGDHLTVFGGHDPSGTSWLNVRVEPAYSSF